MASNVTTIIGRRAIASGRAVELIIMQRASGRRNAGTTHSKKNQAKDAEPRSDANNINSRGGRRSVSNKTVVNDLNTRDDDGGGGGKGRSGRGQKLKNTAKRQGRQHSNNRGANNEKKKGVATMATTPSIETTDFQTIFHARLCRAAKYKVHLPLCNCPKVARLRQQQHRNNLADANGTEEKEKVALNNNASRAEEATDSASINAYSHEVQFDIDGRFSHQLSQLNIATSNDGGECNTNKNDPYDNLIVVPDTKSTPAIYVCKGTNLRTFQRDGVDCERKLAREIFGSVDGVDISQEKVVASDGNNTIPPFKVNCAICLLTTHHRNGFVAIVSQTLKRLQPTIKCARDAMSAKVQQQGLHADHAHFICGIELSLLQSLLLAGKTRNKSENINMEILTQMKEGGSVDLSTVTTNELSQSPTSVQIKMGHHLTTLLYLLQNPSDDIINRNLQYIIVLGYTENCGNSSGAARSNNFITLDLPGGKRHLGETTLRGAIREVEEECSLQIDEGWFSSRVSKQYGGGQLMDTNCEEEGDTWVQVLEPQSSDSGDAFFLMTPPLPPP